MGDQSRIHRFEKGIYTVVKLQKKYYYMGDIFL